MIYIVLKRAIFVAVLSSCVSLKASTSSDVSRSFSDRMRFFQDRRKALREADELASAEKARADFELFMGKMMERHRAVMEEKRKRDLEFREHNKVIRSVPRG